MDPARASLAGPAIRAGAWTVRALTDGEFRLDGGAMWGVVPRVLWQEWTPPAADHTIRMALRPFLCERGPHKVLIEGGVGDRWDDKRRAMYHLPRESLLQESLAACGVAPHEITHVVLSHCHWDHIGALVVARPDQGGATRLEPRFAAARHVAPSVEIELAQRPGHARAASYRSEDVRPLLDAGLLDGVEGSREILPDLFLHVLGGHSDGVGVVTLEGDRDHPTAIFWSDVVPTTHHVQPPYIMAYDLDVARSFEVRSRWLERACSGGWTGLFYHDPEHAFGRLERDGRRYRCAPLAAPC